MASMTRAAQIKFQKLVRPEMQRLTLECAARRKNPRDHVNERDRFPGFFIQADAEGGLKFRLPAVGIRRGLGMQILKQRAGIYRGIAGKVYTELGFM